MFICHCGLLSVLTASLSVGFTFYSKQSKCPPILGLLAAQPALLRGTAVPACMEGCRREGKNQIPTALTLGSQVFHDKCSSICCMHLVSFPCLEMVVWVLDSIYFSSFITVL